MAHFTSNLDTRIIEARAPFFDSSLTPKERQARLMANRAELKVPGQDGNMVKVCTAAACKIFGVSRSFWYPSNEYKPTRSEANMSRAKKNVAITAWLRTAKDMMDVMPDDGFFLCNFPRKKDLYDQFMLDVEGDVADVTHPCHKSYFLQTMRQMFPEIRVRKHCKFAKCDFCQKWKGILRDQKSSAALRAEAKERFAEHVTWAHVRERGFYHSKQQEAVNNPAHFLSVALDGTDQMPNGFPHFGQKIKGDGTGKRLKMHTQIAMVHGRPAMVFVACEDIAGDPNLTIECLNRIFKREEEQREYGLPETLYLQLDNCFRENKNTYVFVYLVWLIERAVFKEIFVSFLPVGHTHFDADQLASRISVAIKNIDVTTILQYLNLLKSCYTSKQGEQVDVSMIHDVLDHRTLFNPSRDKTFPVSTSRCLPIRGIGTKTIGEPQDEWFKGPSGELHWRMRLDTNQEVMVQSKHTVDDPSWSAAQYVWNPKASRPDNREGFGRTSGLEVGDLRIAKSKRMKTTRATEVTKALDKIKSRLSDDEWQQVTDLLERVTKHRKARRCPSAIIKFGTDMIQLEPSSDDDDDAIISIRKDTIWPNLSSQNRARESRIEQGHAANILKITHFLAYTGRYAEGYDEAKKQDCWLGCIERIHSEDGVLVRRWHTNRLDNISCRRDRNPSYGLWQATKKEPGHEWVDVSRILITFPELTKKTQKIKQSIRRLIANALLLKDTNEQSRYGPLAAGVGQDQDENPSKRQRRS